MILPTPSSLQVETFPVGSFACNCSVIFSTLNKSAIVIDPGNDPGPVLNVIKKHQLKVNFVLHTHAHFDHIGESAAVCRELGAQLALHPQDFFLYERLEEQGAFFGQPLSPPGQVQIKLEDEMSFGQGEDLTQVGSTIKVLHTPGHTPGSCCFYTEALGTPLLLSGDTLFQGSIGRTDLPGGDFSTIVSSIKKRLYALPDETIVVPGHGPKSNIRFEKKQNPFVRA